MANLFTAFTEASAADTAASATQSVNTRMSGGTILCLVFDLYLIVCGLAGLINKKIYGGLARSANRYTEESL